MNVGELAGTKADTAGDRVRRRCCREFGKKRGGRRRARGRRRAKYTPAAHGRDLLDDGLPRQRRLYYFIVVNRNFRTVKHWLLSTQTRRSHAAVENGSARARATGSPTTDRGQTEPRRAVAVAAVDPERLHPRPPPSRPRAGRRPPSAGARAGCIRPTDDGGRAGGRSRARTSTFYVLARAHSLFTVVAARTHCFFFFFVFLIYFDFFFNSFLFVFYRFFLPCAVQTRGYDERETAHSCV